MGRLFESWNGDEHPKSKREHHVAFERRNAQKRSFAAGNFERLASQAKRRHGQGHSQIYKGCWQECAHDTERRDLASYPQHRGGDITDLGDHTPPALAAITIMDAKEQTMTLL